MLAPSELPDGPTKPCDNIQAPLGAASGPSSGNTLVTGAR